MSADPLIHPYAHLTTRGGDDVAIDVEMIPVIRQVWRLGLATTACCQDVGEATAAVRALNDHRQGCGGDGFIAFHSGYALLKMPCDDARQLVTLLASDPLFRNRVSQRWRAGCWRMNVPLTYVGGTARVAEDALLHFPRIQIPEVTDVLARL